MRDIDALRHFGCTEKVLEQIFTATTDDPDKDKDGKEIERTGNRRKLRSKWEKRIRSRLSAGIVESCRNSRHYQAVDLAWDSTPISDQNIPLLMYAQGKIDIKKCAGYLSDLKCSGDFLEKDDHGDVIAINMPKLYEVSVNLVRSFINRRQAAQTARFSNLFPFFKYEPNGTLLEDKLRGDLVSARGEIMTNQYGYRPFFSVQVIRDMLMYSFSLVFPTSRWHEEKQIQPVSKSTLPSLKQEEKTEDGKFVTRLEREGIEWVNPHPSRIFRDNSRPLAKINVDLGPEYVGYWDVDRAGAVLDNDMFFNRDKLEFSETLTGLPSKYSSFFGYYFDPCRIKFPTCKGSTTTTTTAGTGHEAGFDNDEKQNVGRYNTETEDNALFITHYYEKVNPKGMGIADYPHDVWVHLIVVNDGTVVFGEWLPSIPAAFGGVNVNDAKILNNSMAHDIMPYQDQLSNILSQMLLNMKAGLLKIYIFNSDVLEEDVKKSLKKTLKSDEYYVNPQALFVSLTQYADMGIDPKSIVQVVETDISHNISDSIRAIGQLLTLAERLLVFSPQELGQPAPREISAREVQEIANTTSSIFTTISESIDTQREAVKKMIYESLICCSSEKLELPTLKRYSRAVVERAGFEILGEEDETEREVVRRTIVGNVKDLRHNILFSARDGAERFSNTQGAQVLQQLIGQVANVPAVMEKLQNGKLFEIFNEIFRLSGSNLNLEADEEIDEDVIDLIKTSLKQLNDRLFAVEQAAGIAAPAVPGAPPAEGGAPPPATPPV